MPWYWSAVHGDWKPGQGAHSLTLNERFDADALPGLRQAVLAVAEAAGLTADRALDVMIAVNELASNAVLYGGGTGRARIDVEAGELRCHVADDGPGRSEGHDPADPELTSAWPVTPGHGLWIVRNAADRLTIKSGPGGSEVRAAFRLSAGAGPTGDENRLPG